MSGGVFSGMNNAIMEGLNAVLAGQTSVYGTMISVIAVSSFTSFIVFKGYQTLAGKLTEPVPEVIWDAARLFLILTFVLNLEGWLDISIAAINGLKEGVSGHDNVWALLDSLWNKAQKLGSSLYDKDTSTYFKFEGGFAEFLVWLGAIILLVIATAVNLLAEITILLMTTTAPIFIFCLSYGFLKPMFNNWLGTIFTAILTIMFNALFVRISINYLNDILTLAEKQAEDSNMVTLAAQSLLAAIGSALLVWFSAKIAGALSGVAVQATLQAAAKVGIKGLSLAGAGATKAMGKQVGKGLGKIGDMAANNMRNVPTPKSSSEQASAARKASIQTMQRINNLRK
ncbi:TPA: type IV secretion system protein [Providencia alcalifaciens]